MLVAVCVAAQQFEPRRSDTDVPGNQLQGRAIGFAIRCRSRRSNQQHAISDATDFVRACSRLYSDAQDEVVAGAPGILGQVCF